MNQSQRDGLDTIVLQAIRRGHQTPRAVYLHITEHGRLPFDCHLRSGNVTEASFDRLLRRGLIKPLPDAKGYACA